MATIFSNNPTGGGFEAGGYFYVTSPDSAYGILPSELLIGGHQEFITLDDRDAIPIKADGSADMITPDGLGSGRRRIGMVVKVIDPEGNGQVESKTYCLIPKGYFGNEGQLSITNWNALSAADKLELLDPTVNTSYVDDLFNTVQVQGSGNADDCWVELIQFTEHPLPSGGSAGEVLAKIDSDDHNVGWVSLQTEPQGILESSYIGNMFTHSTVPGNDDGPNGLIMNGDVQVSTGDVFTIMVFGAEGVSSEMNGSFIATSDFTMQGATGDVDAIFNILLHYNSDFEIFTPSLLPNDTLAKIFTITVSANNKYEVNGVEQDTITLTRGFTYTFVVDDLSSTHPFSLSTTDDGTHGGGAAFIAGVTFVGNTTNMQITVGHFFPDQLYYYCQNHAGMGGSINIVDPTGYTDTDTANFLNGNLNGHIIPDTNAAYDIGSAEYKVRHLFLSDNSVYFGNENVPLNSIKVRNTLNFSVDATIPNNPIGDPAGGFKGDIRFDQFHLYICVEDGLWKRIALDDAWGAP